GLTPVEGEHAYNETYPEGQIFEQTPAADSRQAKNTAVTFSVSKGPAGPSDGVEVPRLEGMSASEARSALEAVGLKVGNTTTEHSGTVAKDKVTRSDPEEGDRVAEATEVDLYLSDGQVQIPNNLEGMTRDQAQKALTDLGLSPVFTEEEAPETPGTVVSSTPRPGEVVGQRTVVQVIIASEGGGGPEATVPSPGEVRGKSPAAVDSQLRSLGFYMIHQNQVFDDSVPAGQVISVTPSGRQSWDTPLTINVSRGKEENP
ncbi:MAG: PASTA domain-containing protein, partial [Micrococcales bacterium]|nr:PASTA domain-containing protein [Micrococcales bacterium]